MPLTPSEKQAAYRARKAREQSLFGPPPGVTGEERAFWLAFPAREGDLAPSAKALKNLGETVGSRADRSTR